MVQIVVCMLCLACGLAGVAGSSRHRAFIEVLAGLCLIGALALLGSALKLPL